MARSEVRHSYRVVLAHHDQRLQSPLRRAFLSTKQFTVVAEASTGSDAIRAVRRHRPDGLVLGVLLPRVNALRALPVIRADSPDTTIMVLAVEPSPRLVHVAIERGAHLCECAELEPAAIASRLLDRLELFAG